jgi:biopolymer transport protein ExbB/TolQ
MSNQQTPRLSDAELAERVTFWGAAFEKSEWRDEILERFSEKDAEIKVLREALEQAREALNNIASVNAKEFLERPEYWGDKMTSEAEDALAAIEKVLKDVK